MANRYWVAAAGGDWFTAANWSATSGGAGGASTPVAGDSVFFDLNRTGTITSTGGGVNQTFCFDFNVSNGNYTFNFLSASTQLFLNGSLNITATSGSWPGTSTITFNGNGANILNVPYTVAGAVSYSGSGSSLTLSRNFTTSSTFVTTSANTLNLNGFNLSATTFIPTGSASRTINFGSGFFYLTNTTSGSVLSIPAAAQHTFSGTGGFSAAMTVARTFAVLTASPGDATLTSRPNLFITSGGSTATFTEASGFDKIDFTGSTCSAANSTGASGIRVNTLVLATGGTYTSFIPVFTTTQTWTPQFSKQLGGMGVNATAGDVTLTLGGAQTFAATAPFYLVSGTLDLNGYDITVGTFNSSSSNTRSVVFGSNYITLATTTAAQTNLSMANAASFTPSGAGGFKAAADLGRVFTFGTTSNSGTSTNSPNLTFTSGATTPTLTTGSTFNTVDFSLTAFNLGSTSLSFNSLILSSGGTFLNLTVTMFGTGSITSNSNTVNSVTINHSGTTTLIGSALNTGATNSVTLTSGTLDLNGNNVTTGTFSSSNSNTRSIVFGSNFIFTTTATAAAVNVSMAAGTNFSCSGTGGFSAAASATRTFTIGTSAAPTVAPNLTITGSGSSIQTLTTGGFFGSLNFNSTTFAVPATAISVFGDLTLSAAGTYSSMTVTKNGGGYIYGNSKALAALTINHPGATTYIGSAVTVVAGGTTTLTLGTFDLNGFNFTTGIFSSSSATNVRTLVFGTATITLTTTTAAATVLNMNNAANFTASFSGAGGFYAAMSTTRTFSFGNSTAPATAGLVNLYLTSGASVPTITTGSYFDTVSFGTCSFTLGTTTINCESFTASASTTSHTGLSLNMIGTGTITPKTAISSLTINYSGTTSLGAATTVSGTTTFTTGTFDLNGFSFTSATTTKDGGTITNSVSGTPVNFTTTGTFTLNDSTGLTLPITADTTFSANTSFVQNATSSGTVTINSSQNFGTACTYLLTTGTLTLNSGSSLTVGIFSSNNSNVRTVNFGTGYIYLTTTTAAATNLNMGNCVNAAFSGSGGFSAIMSVTRSFYLNLSSDIIPSASANIFIPSGASTATFQNNSSINSLVATHTGAISTVTSAGSVFCKSISAASTVGFGSNLVNLVIKEGGGTISLGNFTGSSTLYLDLLTIDHDFNPGVTTLTSDCYMPVGTLFTITLGGIDLNGYNLYTPNISSAAAADVVRSINFGSNFIYLLNNGANQAALDVDQPQGFTYTGTGGFSTDMSTQGAFNKTFRNGYTNVAGGVPNSINECPNVFLTNGGGATSTFSFTGFYNTVDHGTAAATLSTQTFSCANFVASPNATYTSVNLASRLASGTFNFGNKTFLTLDINPSAGQTTTFASSVTVSSTTGFDHVSGNYDLNTYTLNIGNYASSGTGTRQILGTGTINCSLAWTITTGTGYGGSGSYTINMTRATTAKTFGGGGGSYGTLVQAGTGILTISGSNTFTDIQATTIPSTITFTAGSTQTLSNFTLSGTAGNLVTINSTVSGTQFNLSKSSGTVTVNYLSIRDSNVTGGAYWGTTTSNFITNNTGWNVVPSVPINGQFFNFF
jgi:hypothetical protein